ncbi:MAG: 4Fe-4S ferredoxin, partial [Deltaproteobacteria bacterium]|nr:4Fe-4S ferredoxin [Deltaproteobacteria bacterium]
VTVFEASSVPGGMLYLGVPEYRLPRDLLLQEVEFIENLGVEIRFETRIGEDVLFEDLNESYDAVFVGAGCMKGRDLAIEGTELDGVLKAVDFLLNVNLNYRVEIGERVVVIGGGNVAFDAARSAARHGGTSIQDEEDHHAMVDVARLAKRSGAREVTLVCLES